jgi:hypothetical protein
VRATTRRACLTLVAALAFGCSGAGEGAGTPLADRPPGDVTEDPGDVTEDPGDATGGAGSAAPEAGPEAGTGTGPLDFTARALGGGTIEAGTYAGGHVVLWMWAPW